MSIRKLVLLAAISALGLMSIGVATSSATSFLREGPSAALMANGATITNGGSDPAVLNLTGFGAITCGTTAFSATIHTNGLAVITGTLNSLSFTSCTDTIPVLTITSCGSVAPLPTITLTGTSSSTGQVALHDTKVFCHVAGSTTGCYYTAALAAGNTTGSTLFYSNVGVTHATGSGDLGSLCGSNAELALTATDLTDSANGTTVTLRNS